MPDDLPSISDKAVREYRRRQAKTFLECAINLLAHDYRPDEVAVILRKEAEMLEEWG